MENGNSQFENLAERWIEARFDLDEEGKRIARKAFLAGVQAGQHPHAAEEAPAHACKRCGKPVLKGGHFDVADIDGVVTVTNAFCEKHWQEVISRGE